MFTDSRLSLELSSDFKQMLRHASSGKPIDFAVNILTSMYWPFPTAEVSCFIPTELTDVLRQFESFYLSKHSGRRLTWLKHMGTADVWARFPNGSKKELNMSTYCMLVLMNCFNAAENTPVSYAGIKAATEIAEEELKRALLSLSLGKYRILTKMSKGKDIGENDLFQVNDAFSAPL
ncbi:Cullin-3, partial [Kappamyces sp. JEL0680]